MQTDGNAATTHEGMSSSLGSHGTGSSEGDSVLGRQRFVPDPPLFSNVFFKAYASVGGMRAEIGVDLWEDMLGLKTVTDCTVT